MFIFNYADPVKNPKYAYNFRCLRNYLSYPRFTLNTLLNISVLTENLWSLWHCEWWQRQSGSWILTGVVKQKLLYLKGHGISMQVEWPWETGWYWWLNECGACSERDRMPHTGTWNRQKYTHTSVNNDNRGERKKDIRDKE